MFYFLWAFKNLYRNKKRTVEMILFIIIISMMFFLNFAFLKGGQSQMKQTLHNFIGDIALTSKKNAQDKDFNLSGIKDELATGKNKDAIKMIVGEYSFGNAAIISDNGYMSNSYIKGYSPNYFKQLDKSVEWINGSAFFDKPNQALIERTTATRLSVSVGDNVTVRYKTPDGAINTAPFKISGVCIGNKYIHDKAVLVRLTDSRNVGMVEENYVNHMKILLNNPENDVDLSNIVNNELEKKSAHFYISVWRWDPGNVSFSRVFQFSQAFFTIIITVISIVFLIVLFFGIQYTFFLTFSTRANEISVLTTYGMPFTKIYKLVFWETVLYFAAGLIGGFILSLLMGNLLSGINMTKLTDEMVVILGGPNLQFNFALNDFAWVVLFIFTSGLIAGFHSLRKYFKMEVREMKIGI